MSKRPTHVCADIGERYVGRHPKDANPNDPGFCYCGLGLEAWVHTDTTHYREVPLSSLDRFAREVSDGE